MKIFCLSLSIIEADNRVIRQCTALKSAGYDVTAFGLYGQDTRQKNYDFKICHIGKPPPAPSGPITKETFVRLKERLQSTLLKHGYHKTYRALKSFLAFIHLLVLTVFKSKLLFKYALCKANIKGYWKKIYWRAPIFHDYVNQIEKQDLSEVKLIIANDWQMLPIANFFQKKHKIKVAYDSHEHALSENNHSFIHKHLMNGYLFQLEKENLQHASFITSVSNGILHALQNQYSNSCPHFAVRSTPQYESVKFRPTKKESIVIYFHGYLKENRNLDLIVKALQFLPDNYTVLFRGGHYSSLAYEKALLAIAKNLNVDKRFHIAPMAMHGEMVNLASQADIGLSLPPLNSLHSDMALPNKFFEYVMSGLSIGVSDVKEMSSYINKYKLGFVIKEMSSKTIATTISSLTIDEINFFRQNSLLLAKELNWETEQNNFIHQIQHALEL